MIGINGGTAEVTVGERRDGLRRVLVERRRELFREIQSRMRDVRAEGPVNDHITGLDDAVDAEPEDDLLFAVIQIKAQTLQRVNEAVRRVDQGTYGYCVDCGDVIPAPRLRAVPFAVRCRECEQVQEYERGREHVHAWPAARMWGR